MILFLHFLMMASALLCLSSSNETFHDLEYLISSSKVLKNEVSVVNFEKPMIQFVLSMRPMTFVNASCLFFCIFNFNNSTFLLSFLLYLLAAESNVAFFSKQRLKVITWDGSFFIWRGKNLSIMMDSSSFVLANLTFRIHGNSILGQYLCLFLPLLLVFYFDVIF